MSDQFSTLCEAKRPALQQGQMVINTPFGSYLNHANCTAPGKLLRLKTLDELQADWCITRHLWQDCEDDMNAAAIACKRFHGIPEEQELADRYGLRHAAHSLWYGKWENQCVALQAEMLWRLEHPDYNPDDPFRDE